MKATGTFRIYFNRHGAAPLVWCVATDDWELAVAAVEITAAVRTVYEKKLIPDEEDGRPSAWLEVKGELIVSASCARISP
jgi:hypothetical protein